MEALLASAILLIGVLSVTVPFASAARNERADSRQTLAVALAQEMVDEILSKRFYDSDPNSRPGPEPNETSRSLYDNYDDYNGYTEAAGSIRNFQGVACTDDLAADLSRSVAVTYVRVPGQSASDPCTFVLIQVTIRAGPKQIVTLSRLAYAYP
jgi:hypothetical protein